MNNLPEHHGAGHPEVRGPMQLHRLHRLKAGPDLISHQILATLSENATTAFQQKRPYRYPSELTVNYNKYFMKPPKRW